MTTLPRTTVPLIADRLNIHREVTLSALTAHEVLHRADASFEMELTLRQIGQGEGREAEWARKVLQNFDQTQPKLKYPSRLVRIEVA
jgi:hypothetical protein